MSNLILPELRRCAWCAAEIVRKRYGRGKLEAPRDFAIRKFCGDPCARKAQRAAAESKGSCTAPGCSKPATTVGLCSAHYHRLNRYGSPAAGGPLRILDLETRIWSQVDKDGPIPAHRSDLGPCWVWRGQVNNKGYGFVSADGRKRAVHIVVYELVVGPVPEGLELDHVCRNRVCCRPGVHTEPVTHAENQRRMGEALTACRRSGHPYTPENTYFGSRGERKCRECSRERDRARAARRRSSLGEAS